MISFEVTLEFSAAFFRNCLGVFTKIISRNQEFLTRFDHGFLQRFLQNCMVIFFSKDSFQDFPMYCPLDFPRISQPMSSQAFPEILLFLWDRSLSRDSIPNFSWILPEFLQRGKDFSDISSRIQPETSHGIYSMVHSQKSSMEVFREFYPTP